MSKETTIMNLDYIYTDSGELKFLECSDAIYNAGYTLYDQNSPRSMHSTISLAKCANRIYSHDQWTLRPIELMQQAIDLAIASGSPKSDLAVYYSNIASFYCAVARYANAVTAAEKSLELRNELGCSEDLIAKSEDKIQRFKNYLSS